MDSQKKKRCDLDQQEAVAAGDVDVTSIGEDLLHEILLCLPPSSLLSTISVSKSWHRLCSSPLFHHQYRSRRASSFLGFFVNFTCQTSFFFASSSSPTAETKLDSVQILDSRGGWLLLHDLASSSLRLFHPIINKTLDVVVDQPSNENLAAAFHVLLPDPFSLNPLRRFRILRLSMKPLSRLVIEIYSSESPGEWKQIHSSSNIRPRRCFSELHPVLVNGFIHWINGDRQILAMDEKNCEISILGHPRELPLYITHRCLGKLNGRLCYAYVEESVLYVWVLVDRCYCEWDLEHRIELMRFQELDLSNHVKPMAFGVGGSSNVVFLGLMEKIFSLDFGSGKLMEFCNIGLEVDHVFPYNSMEDDCSISSMLSCEALL